MLLSCLFADSFVFVVLAYILLYSCARWLSGLFVCCKSVLLLFVIAFVLFLFTFAAHIYSVRLVCY